jgi:hypothetical protein
MVLEYRELGLHYKGRSKWLLLLDNEGRTFILVRNLKVILGTIISVTKFIGSFQLSMKSQKSINENAEPDVRVDMEDRGRSLQRYMNN